MADPAKALLAMLTISSWIIVDISEIVSSNDKDPKEVTDDGIVTYVNPDAPLNVLEPIDVIPLGIVILLSRGVS